MTEETAQKRQSMAASIRIGLLIAVIGALAGGWYFAWERSARELARRADLALTDLSQSGLEIHCANRQVAGFPFRIGITCEQTSVYFAARGERAGAGALRTASQFYDPGRIVAELEGPAQIERAAQVPLLASWESLRASARLGREGLTAFSIETRQIGIADGWTDGTAPFATAQNAQLHFRFVPDQEGAIDVAFSGTALQPAAAQVAPFDVKANIRLQAISGEIDSGLAELVRREGLEGDITEFTLSPEPGGRLAAFGDFAIGTDGLLSASILFDAEDIAALASFAAQVLPQQRDLLADIGAVLKLLSASGGNVGGLQLTVREGNASLGPFELGRIPPLI